MASRRLAAASAAATSPSPRLLSRPGLAGPAGRCWYSDNVNLWEDPKNPMRWKANHFIAATLTVWGVCLYGGFKIFGGEKTTKVSAAQSKKE